MSRWLFMHTDARRSLLLAPLLALLAACAAQTDADDGDERPATTSQAMSTGSTAMQWCNSDPRAKATVSVNTPTSHCTGVLIGPRHVLTAAHCEVSLTAPSNVVVSFYGAKSDCTPGGDVRRATQVDLRPGVQINPGGTDFGTNNDDLQDTSDKFADLALIHLDDFAPSYTRPARLPLSYPGNEVWGASIGGGMHFGNDNPDDDLRMLLNKTFSSQNDHGHFLVNDAHINHGDSGGPFFTGYEWPIVHGVLFGSDIEWGVMRGKYASIEWHLSWLLKRMSYDGGFVPMIDRVRVGTSMGNYSDGTTDWRRCALRCAQTTGCRGYNHSAFLCNLLSSVTGNVEAPGWRSGATWTIKP